MWRGEKSSGLLTASKILEELLDNLHVAGHLLASHLLNAVIAVVDAEDLFATKDCDTDSEDVFADEHVTPVKLASHGELPAAHVRHEEDGCIIVSLVHMVDHSDDLPSTKASSSSGRRQTPPLSFWLSLCACLFLYCLKVGQK